MARNGSGTYNRAVSPYTAGTTITAATVNSEMDDIATALTGSMARDGQSPPTANIPMGGFRLTGLGNAVASTDAAPLGQVMAKAGDTMTGALGVVAGTAAAPGVFVSGDTNTGVFQAAAAPDTLSVSVGSTEVARFGAGGFMRLADGTAAAPAYSFLNDSDTGFYNESPGSIGVTANGNQVGAFGSNQWFLLGNSAQATSFFYMINSGASASQQRSLDITALNEGFSPLTTIRSIINTDGSGPIEIYATPPGSRTSDRRVLRATIPGSGAINLVGPVNVDGKALQIQRGAEQATTSGTAIDFTSIPAGVRRITVMFNGVSTNGSSILLVQLGTSGGIVSSGYTAGVTSGTTHSSSTAGFPVAVNQTAASEIRGILTIQNISGNNWIVSGAVWNGTFVSNFGGSVGLAAVLDRIRLTATNGTDVFDAGAVNIFWEF